MKALAAFVLGFVSALVYVSYGGDPDIQSMISRMSVAEKIGQLKQGVLYTREDVDRFLPVVRRGEVGSFIFNETLDRAWRDELQKAALASRIGIPLSFADNIIHGWRTDFPIPLALACAFEPELFERVAHIGAREGREAGLDWSFGPMCDTARDPRWGRVAEGCGEDPWLNGVYAIAQVRGFQGEDPSAPDRVAACIKHYCGYSSSSGGHDYNDADFSEWTLRNLHLPPFRAAVKAGAVSLMSGFNTVDGIPVLASRRLMTDILRGEFGFKGLVVTDYDAVHQMISWGVASDSAGAALACFKAGNDVEMKSSDYDTLEAALAGGRLSLREIDESVRRVLEFKRTVGLFRRPMSVPRPDAVTRAKEDAEARALARECALKSVVLVQNDGSLPLGHDGLKVALIGPLALDRKTMVGCWSGQESFYPETRESLADAIRREMNGRGSLTVVKGCSVNAKSPVAKRDDGLPVLDRMAVPVDDSFDLAGAIAAAQTADIVVFALGEAHDWTGENASRCLLTPTGRQLELFEKVSSVIPDKRIVTILSCGRPLAVPSVWTRSNAVFYAFHGGTEGPAALAELLFGKESPSGRLPISVPHDVSQVPVFYNSFMTGRPHQGHYLDTPERGARFPFGRGLTYSQFDYSPVRVTGRVARATVRNVGRRPGTETVQLYVRQCACIEGIRPRRELRGFRRVTLEPGTAEEVAFELSDETLGYVDRAGRDRCDCGAYEVWIAPDSGTGEPAELIFTEANKGK